MTSFNIIMKSLWKFVLVATSILGVMTSFVFLADGKIEFSLLSFCLTTIIAQSYYMVGKVYFKYFGREGDVKEGSEN